MKVVWKYTLVLTGEQTITVPYGAKFLCVKEQFSVPVVYVLVDTTYDTEPRVDWSVYIFGTGHPIDESKMPHSGYVGTLVTANDTLVWHIWIRGRGVGEE